MADVVKYGIQIPNRVFVGGVAFDTKEEELKEFFSQYGKVKECKIIKDNQSISRGFAFVTFECKHDAIQTQQLGTVFFNQKKLNLGPAIRQKGVVFNGAAEFDNEPVLSTGVYIHPSGYSYTVAPNGVWYFHNADGSPRPRTPGSPSMSYSPGLVNKIQQTTQEYQAATGSPSHTPHNTPPHNSRNHHSNHQNRQNIPTSLECDSPVPVSVIHGEPPPDVPYQTTQILQNVPSQPTGYVHHTHSTIGSSNIHVAFQNMSISSHTAPSLPTGHHVHLSANPNVQSPPPPMATHNAAPMQMNSPPVHHSHHSPMHVPVEYARYGEVILPSYYTPNIKHTTSGYNDGAHAHAHMDTRANLNGHCHYPLPVQKPGYYTMMPNGGIRDSYLTTYPVYDPYRPAIVYPQSGYNTVPVSESPPPPCYYKKMYPRHQNASRPRSGKMASYHNEKDALKIDTKCA